MENFGHLEEMRFQRGKKVAINNFDTRQNKNNKKKLATTAALAMAAVAVFVS